MNGVTIRKIEGDYGCGESNERRRRLRALGAGQSGQKFHTAMKAAEINRALAQWPRHTSWYRTW